MKKIYAYFFVINMAFSINVISDERASYGNCYLALGYIQGKLQNKIDNFVDDTGLDPTKMEVFERKDKKLYFTLGIIDEDLYKSIKREGLTSENMWCTSGKGYETRYNLDSNSNLIVTNPKKFTIRNKNDYLNILNSAVDSSEFNSNNTAIANLQSSKENTTNNRISKDTLEKIKNIGYKSSLPNCLEETPTYYKDWEALFIDGENGELIDSTKLNNCQVAVAYDGKGEKSDRVFFVGEYQNGSRSHGVMMWTSGATYDGQWDGWIHGEGVYTYKDNKLAGLWYDGSSLENKCEAFGFKKGTAYSRRCQEIFFDEYSKD
tara:strand:+ start:137 stop:1093 length:957 start_codon:yes stop_codon:yes gene_type:complete